MATIDHPYIDNNGPTYMYGVCAQGRCGKPVSEHETMIRADRPGGRRRTVRVPTADHHEERRTMTDEQPIAVQPEILQATMTVHTDAGTIEADPVMVRPGQAAEGHITMDTATGRIGTVGIDVVDIAQPEQP